MIETFRRAVAEKRLLARQPQGCLVAIGADRELVHAIRRGDGSPDYPVGRHRLEIWPKRLSGSSAT